MAIRTRQPIVYIDVLPVVYDALAQNHRAQLRIGHTAALFHGYGSLNSDPVIQQYCLDAIDQLQLISDEVEGVTTILESIAGA